MRLLHVLSIAVALSAASASSNSSTTHPLNGWYPCSDLTFSDEGSSSGQIAECTIYSAPLCCPGICEAPTTVEDDSVDIFVKRLLATSGDPNTTKNVWIMEGGPGASSASVETVMRTLHVQLGGTVNVYTMDHRGTGRSTLLDCVAAQAATTGSPSGNLVESTKVPACAQALQNKFGNLSSFSMTSAATDLSTFISNFTNGADTIVYGVSYGTALVERLMHLNTSEVVGYVLDGIATNSGAPADKFEYYSTWDTDFDEVGDAFMALCANDSDCSSHFENKSLPVVHGESITNFGNNPNSTCVALVSLEDASPALRVTLGLLLQNEEMRTLIPPIVYRLARCSSDDVEVLNFFVEAFNSGSSSAYQDDASSRRCYTTSPSSPNCGSNRSPR